MIVRHEVSKNVKMSIIKTKNHLKNNVYIGKNINHLYLKHFFILNQSEKTITNYHNYFHLPTHLLVRLMSLSDSQLSEWRFIFDVVLMSLLFVILLFSLALIFLKQKNVPVSQCIEVDPREPHSITITFVPSTLLQANANSSIINAADQNSQNNNNESRANDAHGMTQTPGSVLTTNDNQTATVA